jgi:hypothetical protein
VTETCDDGGCETGCPLTDVLSIGVQDHGSAVGKNCSELSGFLELNSSLF